MTYTTQTVCRSCHSDKLETAFSLGELFPSNFIDRSETGFEKVPLELVVCKTCNLVQLKHTYSQDEMYRKYFYMSGLNGSMVSSLKDIVDNIEGVVKLNDFDTVIDIGCNDGTLLSLYKNKSLVTVGFDPAYNLKKPACSYFYNDYFTANWYFDPLGHVPAKVITAIAMFYDLPDPNKFLADVKSILHKDGVFVVQLTDLISMLHVNAFDNICLGKDELVSTAKGLRPISTLHVGDKVMTHLGRFRKITRLFETKNVSGKLIRLKAYGNGFDLKVTENHPIWVKRDFSWGFVPAKDIRLGDIVGKPVVSYDGVVSEMNVNLAKISGYYLSEGSYFKSKKGGNVVNFYFNYDEENTLVKDLMEALRDEGHKANLYRNDTALCVTSYGKIATWLYNNFGHLAHNKHIPIWIYGLDKQILGTLLDTYISGDGYIYRTNYYRASTVSRDLAYGISLLANLLGYKCSINEQSKNPTGVIQGRAVNIKNLWNILIHTKPVLHQKVWLENGVQCSRIKSIDTVDYNEDFVYNLEVEDDNTFVTPAMAVHNCHEHLEYYSITNLIEMFNKAGLEIFDISFNNVNGGSVRVLASHPGIYKVNDLAISTAIILQEKLLSGDSVIDTLDDFWLRITDIKQTVVEFLKLNVYLGAVIHGLGASTKGNTLLQFFGIGNDLIPKIEEVNKDKFGKVTLGTEIEIIEETKESNPDCFFILPWHFIDFFLKVKDQYLRNGGTLFVPLPTPKLYYYEDGECVCTELKL